MLRFASLVSCLLALVGCGDPEPLEPTYENVAAVIHRSCGGASNSCHGGINGNARLNFGLAEGEGTPYTELLVDVPACEYDAMPRVDPGNPDNSWLWIKLQGAHDAEGRILFTPAATWDPTGDERTGCPQMEDGEVTFGLLMPQSPGAPAQLPQETLDLFEDWILVGAPGPGEL